MVGSVFQGYYLYSAMGFSLRTEPPQTIPPTGTLVLPLPQPQPQPRNRYENEGFHQPEEQQEPEEVNQRLRVEDTTGLCNKPQRPHTATRQADCCAPETNMGVVCILCTCV